MKLADFAYELPPSAIAQEPLAARDQSRLLVLDRRSKAIRHAHFYDLPDFLRAGDVLVLNSTRVFPARLRGKKKTGGKVEVLLIESFARSKSANATSCWKALVRGVTRPAELVFPEGLQARMTERLADGEWVLEFSGDHLRAYLDRQGEMPLPPYIKRPAPRAQDRTRYQTVYAQEEGAVAAPTAGFHFTPALLDTLRGRGISIQTLRLNVGWGTFRPVRCDRVEDHRMLAETYEVTAETAGALNVARQERRRIIAVGTTSVRTLESAFDPKEGFHAGPGSTDLYIYPGYHFKAVDALITNFHLPDSTPLLLACAFYGGDPKAPFSLRFAYDEAIREGYRFYSYGDAMFIQ